MNPCESLPLSTAPYYREARVTFAWRQTACQMWHCCARRFVETGSRRKLGCTSTRWAERHPQGVCRIRKAAEPPTAAQQRVVGAEANRIAASNAAAPRYGQCNRQALQLFELPACNGNFLWEGEREQKARLQTQAGLSYHLLEKAAISFSTCRPCRPCRRREQPVRGARACRRRAPRWSAPWN